MYPLHTAARPGGAAETQLSTASHGTAEACTTASHGTAEACTTEACTAEACTTEACTTEACTTEACATASHGTTFCRTTVGGCATCALPRARTATRTTTRGRWSSARAPRTLGARAATTDQSGQKSANQYRLPIPTHGLLLGTLRLPSSASFQQTAPAQADKPHEASSYREAHNPLNLSDLSHP